MSESRLIILTCNPESDDLALREARQALPGARLAAELEPGVLLIAPGEGSESAQNPFAALAAVWRDAPPIFARHIAPVDLVEALHGDADDVARLRDAVTAQLAPLIDAAQSFSVQARVLPEHLPYRPYDLNTAISEAVAGRTGADLDVREPEQVISVTVASVDGQMRGYLGVSAVEDNLSAWTGGMRRFAREPQQVSRSEFKLLEALDTFRLHLVPRGLALDLGAAPGGWTRILRAAGMYVTAVDPAELDPRLRHDTGIRHKRMSAETFLHGEPEPFDVIANDMRMDARDSSRLMLRFADWLRPGGFAVMTLKLPEQGRLDVLDAALRILRERYVVAGARQLFHNRSEITVYLLPGPTAHDGRRTGERARVR
ncbi:MAG: 50S rRNA methyltransferase [Anaerolineae bacterium]|nr:50S rRNA methyltransferase [Anaerolineae bacterium]